VTVVFRASRLQLDLLAARLAARSASFAALTALTGARSSASWMSRARFASVPSCRNSFRALVFFGHGINERGEANNSSARRLHKLVVAYEAEVGVYLNRVVVKVDFPYRSESWATIVARVERREHLGELGIRRCVYAVSAVTTMVTAPCRGSVQNVTGHLEVCPRGREQLAARLQKWGPSVPERNVDATRGACEQRFVVRVARSAMKGPRVIDETGARSRAPVADGSVARE
jgi:hypothetical protein